MVNAKINLQDYMNDIYDILNGTYVLTEDSAPNPLPSERPSKWTILSRLFFKPFQGRAAENDKELQEEIERTEELRNRFCDSLQKAVQYRSGCLNHEWLLNFIQNYYTDMDGTGTAEGYDFADLNTVASSIIESKENIETSDSAYYYEAFQKEQKILVSLKDLYNRINPYPWINIDKILAIDSQKCSNAENMDDDISTALWNQETPCLTFHYLLLSAVYVGTLHQSRIRQISGVLKETSIAQKLCDHLSKNKHFVFYGYPESGKSYLLRNFTDEHTILYYDLNRTEVSSSKLLEDLRPDYCFWAKTFPEYTNEYLPAGAARAIINPFSKNYFPAESLNPLLNGDLYNKLSCTKEEAIGTDLSSINFQNITLIIDHVKDKRIMNALKDIACKIIFVMDKSDFDNLPSYLKQNAFFFDNRELLKRSFGKDLQLKDIPNSFDKLYSELGTNVYIYRLISKNYEKCEQDEPGTGNKFINTLINNIEIEAPEIINTYSHSIGMNYKSRSTCRNYDNFISFIYANHLCAENQWLLRLLCRLQESCGHNIALNTVIPYLGEFTQNLTEQLSALGWLDMESLHIPKIIMASFNYRANFKNEEYSFILSLMTEFSLAICGYRTASINKEVCSLIVKCLHDDYKNYIAKRKKHSETKLHREYFNKIYKEAKAANFNVMQSPTVKKRGTPDDPYSEIQYMANLSNRFFYQSALFFAYQYGKDDLWDELYQYVSDYGHIEWNASGNNAPEWELFLQTWQSIRKYKRIPQEANYMLTVPYYYQLSDFQKMCCCYVPPFSLNHETAIIRLAVHSKRKYESYKSTYMLLTDYYINLMSEISSNFCQEISTRHVFYDISAQKNYLWQQLRAAYNNAYKAQAILEELDYAKTGTFCMVKNIIENIYLTILALPLPEFRDGFKRVYDARKEEHAYLLYDQHFLVLLAVTISCEQFLINFPISFEEIKKEFLHLYQKIGDLPNGVHAAVQTIMPRLDMANGSEYPEDT